MKRPRLPRLFGLRPLSGTAPRLRLAAAVLLLPLCGALSAVAGEANGWREQLQQRLPLLGHRNWIVIADAAYPQQTAAGITTIATSEDQLEVVREVLAQLAKSPHVQPVIYRDTELDFVAEANAPGITEYRQKLQQLLGLRPVRAELHEQIIKKLDAAGQSFHVLILKTRHLQPYTSVFLQLECGYWTADKEAQLRAALRGK